MHFRALAKQNFLTLALLALVGAQPVLLQAANWRQVTNAGAPPARNYPSMAYDPVSRTVVMFGGFGNSGDLNDTWSFDGTKWTRLHTTGAPPVRNGAAMAFDRVTQKLVLFGGFDIDHYLNDTWLFDGATSTWTAMHMSSPPTRATGAMAFTDPLTGKATMFGGYNATKVVPVFSTTWQWTGSAWLKLTPATVPIPRGWGTATLDLPRNNVVMTGGTGDTIRADNTWTWDGTNWTQQLPSTQVEAFVGGGGAYDPALQQVVLFGGIAETWSWTGTNWVLIVPGSSPSAREGVGMAYDPRSDQTIIFGGALSTGSLTNETWQLVGK